MESARHADVLCVSNLSLPPLLSSLNHCRMSDGSGDASGIGDEHACVLYARIGTLETDTPEDLTDYWAEPVSYFLVQGVWA